MGGLGEDVVDDISFYVGESVVSAGVAVGEVFVVEAHLVEDSGMEVTDVDGVFFS